MPNIFFVNLNAPIIKPNIKNNIKLSLWVTPNLLAIYWLFIPLK